MARNRSEKCPAVLRQKSVKPNTWTRPRLVQLIESTTSGYIVQIQHHDTSNWHFGVSSSFDDAIADYDAMVEGFSFAQLNRLRWTYYSSVPRYATEQK